MKYINNILVLFLLLSIVSSCQHKMNIEMMTLPVEPFDLDSSQSLSWEIMDTEYLLSYPENMILTDNHLIIQDRKAVNHLFHVISRNDSILNFEFAKKGNAPQEFLDATLNPHWNQEKKIITFYDPLKKKLFSFQKQNVKIDSIPLFAFLDTKNIYLKSEYIREIFPCNDGYLLMGEHGMFDKNRFLLLDDDLHLIKACGDYPNVKPLLTNPEQDFRKMIFGLSFFKISPNGKKAIFATYKGALLQFFDLSHCRNSIVTIKTIQSEYPINKRQISPDHEGWVYGFEDVYVTDSYIYAIYNGQTAVDNPGMGKYILVFNWNGELCNKYQSDMNLRCLAVDETKKIIYAVAYAEDSDFFVAYASFNTEIVEK